MSATSSFGTTFRRWFGSRTARGAAVVAAATTTVLVALAVAPAGAQDEPPAAPVTADEDGAPTPCGEALTSITGTATPDEEKTYHLFPFEVPPGTARIEVGYTWEPIDGGVIDLGVWDASGTSGPDAFRAWGGSRQGRLDKGTAPLVITPDVVERTVVTDAVEPGTWHIELGYAAVEQALEWRVGLRCIPGPVVEPLAKDRVDPTAVERDQAGWYAGDFHLHGFDSSTDGPDPETMVSKAKAAGLDIIPVTDYVSPAHWDRLGATQRAHPDVLIWPGREVITYFGHVIVLSETPSVVEHRVGYEDITIDGILRPAAEDGALVSLAHPTLFPPETFGSTCRGCFNQLIDQIDFDNVTAVEIVTEGSIVEVGGTTGPNPFVRTAIELWEQQLRDGHRLTAISGSDDKSGDSYGSTTTMVYADQLSRPAVDEALRRGHAYVRGNGQASPEMDLVATTPGGETAMFGDTLVGDTAQLTWTVRGGDGQVLSVRQNGVEVERVTITGDEFTHRTTATRAPEEGPLGTFWGAEVLDTTTFPGSEVATTIANPVFLASQPAPEPLLPTFAAPATEDAAASTTDAADTSDDSSSPLPWILLGIAIVIVVVGTVVMVNRRSKGGADVT